MIIAVSLGRLRARARREERAVTLEYLTKLHNELDAWLYTRHDGRVITIDGTLPPDQVYEAFVRALGTVPGLLPA